MPDKAEALEQRFTQELLKNCELAASVCRQERLCANIRKYGGVSCAKNLLRRGHLSDGFMALAAAGHLEWSLEAMVTAGKYGELFTDDEVNACFSSLCDAGYYRFTKS